MKHFLIIQTAFIGDVILATPIIEKLRRYYPDAKIDFLLRKGNEGLLKNHPHINQVLIWKKGKGKYKNLIKLLSLIRKKQYSTVINCQRFSASGFLTAFSSASERIGFKKNPLSLFFTEKVDHKINGTHETSRNLALIKDLTEKKYFPPKLYPNEDDYAFVKQYQKDKYICVSPTSVWKTKELPMVKWLELILSTSSDVSVFLLGGPNDRNSCKELIELSERENVVNLAGELSFLQSVALMEKAEMNYANDSAPMHMASSVEAPINAVYCSTIPAFGFGPLSFNSKVIQTKESLNCRPCGLHGKRKCPLSHFNCAHTIDVKQFDIV